MAPIKYTRSSFHLRDTLV